MTQGDMEIGVHPLSAAEMISQELENGVIKPENKNARLDELTNHLHFKIRIVSHHPFSEVEQKYTSNDIRKDIQLTTGSQSIKQTLFINESILSKEKMVQYFVAFENTKSTSGDLLEIRINSETLGIKDKTFSFSPACFE